MAAFGIKTRLSISKLMLALVELALLLTLIKDAYQPRIYRQDLVLQVVNPADRNETAIKTLVCRSTSPTILAAALSDRRLSSLRRFQDATNPQAELERMASAYVTSVDEGLISVYAESDSEDEATAVAEAIADAYVKDQGPSRVVRGAGVISSCTASTLDMPWKVAVATILALFASTLIVFFPLSWLSPARLIHPFTACFRSSPRRFLLRGLLVLAAIPPVLLVFSLFGFFPWSGVNCWQNEIDISSGRVRETRYLLWVPVTRSVWDSALTNVLSPDDRKNFRADWHAVVTLSPGLHHSPHHQFHGGIHQIQELEFSWKSGKMTPAARSETAQHVFRLWQQKGSYFRAADYLQAVWERAREAETNGKAIDVGDLPAP